MLKHTVKETQDSSKACKTDQTNRVKTRDGEYNLEKILDQVKPTNCHPEHDTDPAQGKEEWYTAKEKFENKTQNFVTD